MNLKKSYLGVVKINHMIRMKIVWLNLLDRLE